MYIYIYSYTYINIYIVKLDQMCDSVSGQTVVDPKGYFTDLNSVKVTYLHICIYIYIYIYIVIHI